MQFQWSTKFASSWKPVKQKIQVFSQIVHINFFEQKPCIIRNKKTLTGARRILYEQCYDFSWNSWVKLHVLVLFLLIILTV
jgi:hypothetical protein